MKTIQEKKAQEYVVKSNGIPLSAKVDMPGRVVTGFYNAYNYLDSDGDILLPGCAKRSIKERGPESNATAKIKHALNHNLTQLPGKIKVLKETTVDGVTGIYFETEMTDTTLGNDTLKNYLAGVYDNHSIGFRYLNLEMVESEAKARWKEIKDMISNPDDMKDRTYIWLVKEIELFEGSTVAFGANSLTPYLGTKSFNKDILKLDLYNRVEQINYLINSGDKDEDMLKSMGLQLSQLKQMLSDTLDQVEFKKAIEKKAEPKPYKINYSKLAADY